jgi:hypothetical protein
LDPIKGLKETLLPKSIEKTIEEQRVEGSDEEGFTLLKESIEEDNEFCEQLIEYFHKYFLVEFHMQRKEEYNTIIQNYERGTYLRWTMGTCHCLLRGEVSM